MTAEAGPGCGEPETDEGLFDAVRAQLASGDYDAAAWRRFLERLPAVPAAERARLQEWCHSLEPHYSYEWIEAVRHYAQRFGALPFVQDAPPPLFRLLSSLYAHIRPNPASMAVIEAAVTYLRREEIDALFDADPWLHNLATSFWEYGAGETRLRSYPWNITIPIADLCNAQCSFCTSWLEGRELISLEQVEALGEVVGRAVYLGLVGHGEPLAHPDFAAIADRLARRLDRRASIYTITNGFLIRRLFSKLQAIRVQSYSISLNAASPATHERVMALGPDGFDEVLRGIRMLLHHRETRDPYLNLYLTMVVTADNIHEVAEFVELGNRLGVTAVWLRSLLPQAGLIPGLNYHTLAPNLHPEFEKHRERAAAAIAASRVPVQADPSAWQAEVLPAGLRERIAHDPPPLVSRVEARRDRDLRQRNLHLYRTEPGAFRGTRQVNSLGTVVTLSAAGAQFSTSDIPHATAFSIPIAAAEQAGESGETGVEVELGVTDGAVAVSLMDAANAVCLDRRSLPQGFDGQFELCAPGAAALTLVVGNAQAEGGVSTGRLRRLRVRRWPAAAPAAASRQMPEPGPQEVPLVLLTLHNATDPLEDGLNPLGRVPRFACKAVYYNLYINEMFFRVNPCCYMQQVPGYTEVRFDGAAPFLEAWNSPAFIELRTRLRDGPLFAACRRCPEKW